MLQYEYSWFKAWETQLLGQTFPRSSLTNIVVSEHHPEITSNTPYGHPAHPFISEIYMVLGMVGRLLAKHSVPRQPEGQPHHKQTNTGGELHSMQVSLWGMP